MKTRAIIEFKDTYASMECHNLGYQTKETALAIMSPTGHILSSTPLFRKAYGSKMTHIDQLPFHIDNLTIKARGLSQKAKANLEDWIAHTIILPMDYDRYFAQHQELLHLLAESPVVESVQALTYKTVKIQFSESLNDEHIRQLQGFILRKAGIYSYIVTPTRRLNGPNSMLMAVRITITDLLFSIATKGYGVASFIKKASLK